jgi:hypothetical protein
MDDRVFEFRQELGIFIFATSSRPALESPQPSIEWITGTLSLGIKRPVSEAHHSPPASAEVKNAGSYNSTHVHFLAFYLYIYSS